MKYYTHIIISFLLALFFTQEILATEVVGSPKGQFAVSSTGAATYSVSIDVPPGISGLQPQIGITYNSQSGMGNVGWGCNITGVSAITRGAKDIYHDGTAKGMSYGNDDAYFLDGKRLILASGAEGAVGSVYHPEGDPYTDVTIEEGTLNPEFVVRGQDGNTYTYGRRLSFFSYALGATVTQAWYLSRISDPCGNSISYLYNGSDQYLCFDEISYGNNQRIIFSYDTLGTAAQHFRLKDVGGKLDRLLKKVECKIGNVVCRTYTFSYDTISDQTPLKFPRLDTVFVAASNGDSLRPITFQWSHLPNVQLVKNTPPGNVYDSNSFETVKSKSFVSLDINGDGLSDLLEIHPMSTQSGNVIGLSWFLAERQVDGSISFLNRNSTNVEGLDVFDWKFGSSLILDTDGDGAAEFIIPFTETDESSATNYCFRILGKQSGSNGISLDPSIYYYPLKTTGEMPLATAINMNGDGRHSLVVLEKKLFGGKYHGRILNWSVSSVDFSLTLSSAPKRLFTGDFNNDGLTDILVFTNSGYSVFYNHLSGSGNVHTFSDSSRLDRTDLHYQENITQGDFNGDGLIDFAMNLYNSPYWYFELNKGDGTFQETLAATLDLYSQSTSNDDDKFSYMVLDFDHDGKSDIVMTKAMYSSYHFLKTHTRWLRSTGTSLVEMNHATSNKSSDAIASYFTIGDYDGDGYEDLLNYGYDCFNGSNANVSPTLNIYNNESLTTTSGKVSSVTDGFGNTTQVSYASLTSPSVYTIGTGSIYPLIDVNVPLHVVSTVQTPTVATSNPSSLMTETYSYEGLKVHVTGRGLLGFAETTVSNDILQSVIQTEIVSRDTIHFEPKEILRRTALGTSTSTVRSLYSVTPNGTQNYFVHPTFTYETDFDGNQTISLETYDIAKGVLSSKWTEYDGTTDFSFFKQKEYEDYIQIGKRWLPQTIRTTQKHDNDVNTFESIQKISYNSTTGLPTQVIDNYGTSLPLTTVNTYNSYGNLTSKTVQGQGLNTVTTNYSYDSSNRFVAGITTSPSSTVTNYTYDLWGNVQTETDATVSANPLTTTNTYDGFGNLKKSISPDSIVTADSCWWKDPNDATQGYIAKRTVTGRPYTMTWYDSRGRETKTQSVGEDGITLLTTTSYDARGNVVSKTSQTGNNISTTETLQYDNRNRKTSDALSTGRSTSYTYTGRKVTATTNGNRVYEKTYDAWGLLTQSKEPIGTVNYRYKSCGKPFSAAVVSSTVTMAYDACGNQTSLTDPDAGITTYTYNAAGNIVSQTDARGIITRDSLDALNRIVKTTTGSTITTYAYGTSGNAKHRLVSKSMSGKTVSYGYDPYGRVTSETRNFGNTSYVTSYEYDANGNLSKTTYPGNVEVTYGYDSNGYETSMAVGGSTVWTLTSHTGTATVEELGTGTTALKRSTSRNDYGLLTGITLQKKSNNTQLHAMTFTHNAVTGNLTQRTGMISDGEVFTYDNDDRLVRHQDVGSHYLDNIVQYATDGNIEFKTGLGNFGYPPGGKPHGVANVTNTGGLLFSDGQQITYNDFGKASVLASDHGGIRYDISYGPDQERWQSDHYYTNMQWPDTVRYYVGDMEGYKVGPSDPVWFYHIGHGVILRKVGNNNNIQPTVYYAFTDHLGSVTRIYNTSGTAVFSAQYDPWGVQTVTTNTIKYNRGYCGHEMLNDLQLINMNGRMYDPYLGRFLSPDSYVQLPTSAQSFNRYSYCLNNPLKYVDPSGELWWLLPAIAGAYFGGSSVNDSFNPFKWDYGNWKTYAGMAVGAVSACAGSYIGSASAASALAGGATSLGAGITGGMIGGMVTGGMNGLGMTAIMGGNIEDMMDGLVKGSIIGGFGGALSGGVNSLIGDFSGVSGSSLKNGLYELAHSALKGAATGLAGGVMVAAMEQDASYLWKGAAYGAAFSVGMAGIRIGLMGTTIIPPGIEGRFDADDAAMGIKSTYPIYRRGGLLKLFVPGITLGRNMMVDTRFLKSDYKDLQSEYYKMLAHERAHIYQQKIMGRIRFYLRVLYEYLISPGYKNDKPYVNSNCLDFWADQYMLLTP